MFDKISGFHDSMNRVRLELTTFRLWDWWDYQTKTSQHKPMQKSNNIKKLNKVKIKSIQKNQIKPMQKKKNLTKTKPIQKIKPKKY